MTFYLRTVTSVGDKLFTENGSAVITAAEVLAVNTLLTTGSALTSAEGALVDSALAKVNATTVTNQISTQTSLINVVGTAINTNVTNSKNDIIAHGGPGPWA